jgi:hypothetical protein
MNINPDALLRPDYRVHLLRDWGSAVNAARAIRSDGAGAEFRHE